MDSGSLFHFLHHCDIGDFWRFVSISHSHSPADFTILSGEITHAATGIHINPDSIPGSYFGLGGVCRL